MKGKNTTMKTNQVLKIPKTGRLGQWVKAMEDEGVSQSVIETVMRNVNQFTQLQILLKKQNG